MSYVRVAQKKIKSQIAFFKGLFKDTEGASAIEYAILVSLVAIVILGFGNGLGTAITTMFTTVQTALTPTP